MTGRYSDLIRAGRSGDRILVGAKFSAPVQTSPGAHPASYTTGTGSFTGVKLPGRGVDNPPPSSAEVKEGLELYLRSLSGPSLPFLGWTLPLPVTEIDDAASFAVLSYVQFRIKIICVLNN